MEAVCVAICRGHNVLLRTVAIWSCRECVLLSMLASAGEMVAIRRERKEEHICAPDVVGEVAILSSILPELATR